MEVKTATVYVCDLCNKKEQSFERPEGWEQILFARAIRSDENEYFARTMYGNLVKSIGAPFDLCADCNPESKHKPGKLVKVELPTARKRFADLFGLSLRSRS